MFFKKFISLYIIFKKLCVFLQKIKRQKLKKKINKKEKYLRKYNLFLNLKALNQIYINIYTTKNNPKIL